MVLVSVSVYCTCEHEHQASLNINRKTTLQGASHVIPKYCTEEKRKKRREKNIFIDNDVLSKQMFRMEWMFLL